MYLGVFYKTSPKIYTSNTREFKTADVKRVTRPFPQLVTSVAVKNGFSMLVTGQRLHDRMVQTTVLNDKRLEMDVKTTSVCV